MSFIREYNDYSHEIILNLFSFAEVIYQTYNNNESINNLDDDVEFLGDGGVDSADLLDGTCARIDLEEVPVISGTTAEKGVANRRVDAVHIHRLDLLRRYVQYAREHSTRNLNIINAFYSQYI